MPYNLAQFIRAARYAMCVQIFMIFFVPFGSFGITLIQKAFAASPKAVVTVEGSVLRVNDIFEGTSLDKIIGAAPHPGQDMVLNARTLLRIAMALDLPWRPESGQEYVIVRRAATVVSQEMIEEALYAALDEKGLSGDFRFIFSNGLPGLILPQGEPANLEIAQMDYDPVSGIFTAQLVAPSKDRPLRRQSVSGKVEQMIALPVLRRAVQNGQVIKAADLGLLKVPSYKVQADYVVNEQNLIGMTPRRMAMAGEPLRQSEVIEPVLIKRGETVTIRYQAGAIELTSEGKALQSGARGELIRVANYSSSRTIEAIVEASGLVVVN